MSDESVVPAILVASVLLVSVVLVALVATKWFRERRSHARDVASARIRERVLVVLDPDLWVIPEVFGRKDGHAERITSDLLSQLRGPDRERLAAVLDEVGALDAASRRLRSHSVSRRLQGLERLGAAGCPRYLPGVTACLRDRDPEVRAAAARAIGQAGDPYFVDALLEALDEGLVPSHTVSMALVRIGATAQPVLVGALSCRSDRTRAVVLDVIGVLGLTDTTDQLLTSLADLEVRRNAVRALGRFGISRTAPPLVAELVGLLHRSDPHRDDGYTADLIEALGLIGDRRAISILTACLAGPHRISSVATTALQRLDARPPEQAPDLHPEPVTSAPGEVETVPDPTGPVGAQALAAR